MRTVFVLLLTALLTSCGSTTDPENPTNPGSFTDGTLPLVPNPTDEPQLKQLNVPEGFRVEYYAKNITNARSMCWGANGTLFVGTRREGAVYALQDTDGDHVVDQTYTLATGLQMPNGVAFKDGALFVAEISRIWRFDDIENKLDNPGSPTLVTDTYPTETHHGWKYIAFGPDGYLYVPVGAPCNICDRPEPIYASITRMKPDGTDREIVARGVRNTVGFEWHPVTGELWFTDNGRDWLGDNLPACELNRLTAMGQHFGYPYYHQGDFPDPDFGAGKNRADYEEPVQNLGPHTAPLGMHFYRGSMFPESFKGHAYIAEHGSWNRSSKIGYRITRVRLDAEGNSLGYEDVVTGWLQAGDTVWGRPVDILPMPDGSLLISDDYANCIYRLFYEG